MERLLRAVERPLWAVAPPSEHEEAAWCLFAGRCQV